MEDLKIKNKMFIEESKLADRIDSLKRDKKDEELIGLLDRADTLLNVVILNFKSIEKEDVDRVDKMLRLLSTNDDKTLLNNASSLSVLVDSLETLFRSKKFLIGTENEEKKLN